jgi:hypothetical protein
MAATETVELLIGQPLVGFGGNSIVSQVQTQPYPYLVVENAIDTQILNEVFYTLPPSSWSSWMTYNNDFERKRTTRDLPLLSPFTRNLLESMQSSSFASIISAITGIPNLITDPGLHGMGIYRYDNGGFLAPHMGYELHPVLNLERRVNVILFLTPDWNVGWGGQHLLWDDVGFNVVQEIEPRQGRMIIYQSQENGWMSVRPIQTPGGENQYLAMAATTYLTQPRTTATRKRAVFIPNRGYEFA